MSNEKSGKSSFIKDLIKDIIIAVVIVLAVTAVIKPTIVKESSMLDTLQENNYLFVNKLAYKFKDHPERGDIIVFRSDLTNDEDGSKKLLIKRVIGVEGDEISFENDQVYRNGEPIAEDDEVQSGRLPQRAAGKRRPPRRLCLRIYRVQGNLQSSDAQSGTPWRFHVPGDRDDLALQ